MEYQGSKRVVSIKDDIYINRKGIRYEYTVISPQMVVFLEIADCLSPAGSPDIASNVSYCSFMHHTMYEKSLLIS
mgnify:CR=1 FL=1